MAAVMTGAVTVYIVAGALGSPPTPQAASSDQRAAVQSKQKVRNPLNDLLDEAQAALDKKDYQAALAPLQKFIAEQPEVPYAHFQLAYAYTALKRTDEAREEYQRCVALDPKMAEAQMNLGILLLDKDPAAAVAPLQKAVELLPSQARPRFLLGLAQERSGDLAGAAHSFDGAVHLDPTDSEALIHLGSVLLQQDHPAAAQSRFQNALELQPGSPAALRGLAQSLDRQKKPEAADVYRHYLAVQPADGDARIRLVHLLIEQQQYDDALAESEKAPGGAGSGVDALKLRADIQIGQNKLDDAIVTLQRAIALAPADAQLHGGLGRIYLQKRHFPEAEKELKAALQLERNNLNYWKDLSSTYYLSGNWPATLATLDVVAQHETTGAGSWFIRALCYDKLNQVQSALDAYRKFLELDQNRNPDQVWQAKQRIHVLEKMAEKKK